jgi:hypothetical protein
MVWVHEGEVRADTGARAEEHEPIRLEHDLQPEPAPIEITTGGQMRSHDDRVEVLKVHRE